MLDEPAVALHPSLQRKLMSYLQRCSFQTVVITHSPYLFPLDEDQSSTRVVRFDRNNNSETIPASVDQSLLAKIIPKLRQTGNERIAFASRVILTEGKIDQAALRALADELNFDLDGRNIVVIDCAGRENIPDYTRFCAALRLRCLVVQDGDASKPDALSRVNAVRDAVSDSQFGTLFEFPENIENTLGCAKELGAVSRAMRDAAYKSDRPSELTELSEKLSDIVSSDECSDAA